MKIIGRKSKLDPRHGRKAWSSLLAGCVVMVLLLLMSCSPAVQAEATNAPSPPPQPASGPGGRDYRHGSVRMSTYGVEERQYWLYEPDSPVPESAPVVVFNHGWLSISPEGYGAWIEHLVRRGNIVIYPAYQDWHTLPWEATGNAVGAVKDALERLGGGGHVAPEMDRFAVVGHSFGGAIAVNMAAQITTNGLPEPGALMLAAPGDAGNYQGRVIGELGDVPPGVLMLAVVGSQDFVVGSGFALRVMMQTPQVPLENKDIVSIVSDNHGIPELATDHLAPIAPDSRYNEGYGDAIRDGITKKVYRLFNARVDAVDYYAYWKLCDGLLDAAFYGENRQYALGDTNEQRFMGRWSDGTPVREIRVWPDF